MSAKARAWFLAGVLGAFVVAVDQSLKAAVEANIAPGEGVDVAGPLSLTLAHNTGVAFGVASGGGALLIGFTLAALGAVALLFSRDPTRPGMWVAVGLLAGGAIGNLIDRVRAEAVTDFIEVGPWPPFNLADIAITLGVLLVALAYLRAGEE